MYGVQRACPVPLSSTTKTTLHDITFYPGDDNAIEFTKAEISKIHTVTVEKNHYFGEGECIFHCKRVLFSLKHNIYYTHLSVAMYQQLELIRPCNSDK